MKIVYFDDRIIIKSENAMDKAYLEKFQWGIIKFQVGLIAQHDEMPSIVITL